MKSWVGFPDSSKDIKNRSGGIQVQYPIYLWVFSPLVCVGLCTFRLCPLFCIFHLETKNAAFSFSFPSFFSKYLLYPWGQMNFKWLIFLMSLHGIAYLIFKFWHNILRNAQRFEVEAWRKLCLSKTSVHLFHTFACFAVQLGNCSVGGKQGSAFCRQLCKDYSGSVMPYTFVGLNIREQKREYFVFCHRSFVLWKLVRWKPVC